MKTFDAVDLDVTSAYLAAASNVAVWPLLSAERIEPVDERAFLAGEIERVADGDVSVVFDLGRSRRLAWIAADVLLSEEPDELPVTTAGDLAGFHACGVSRRRRGHGRSCRLRDRTCSSRRFVPERRPMFSRRADCSSRGNSLACGEER